MAKRLSDKQQKFIDLWTGVATETAALAGYSNPETAGKRCMQNVQICTLIKEKRAAEIKPHVADRIERQEYWSETMRNKNEETKDRLKASELLGRSEGDFLDRVALGGGDKGTDPIRAVLETINGKTKGVVS